MGGRGRGASLCGEEEQRGPHFPLLASAQAKLLPKQRPASRRHRQRLRRGAGAKRHAGDCLSGRATARPLSLRRRRRC